jgi:hypothetical protein
MTAMAHGEMRRRPRRLALRTMPIGAHEERPYTSIFNDVDASNGANAVIDVAMAASNPMRRGRPCVCPQRTGNAVIAGTLRAGGYDRVYTVISLISST